MLLKTEDSLSGTPSIAILVAMMAVDAAAALQRKEAVVGLPNNEESHRRLANWKSSAASRKAAI